MYKLWDKFNVVSKLGSMTAAWQNNQNTKSTQQEIRITVEIENNSHIQIIIPRERLEALTCAWLLYETVRRTEELHKGEDTKKEGLDLLALKTKTKDYAVDCLLNDSERTLEFLNDGTVLETYYGKKVPEELETKVGLKDFHIETKLGSGSYSGVYLVRKISTGKLYALKQVDKGTLTEAQREMLETERNALIEVSSPFVVPLRWVFQTTNYCYFVLDFVPCGDLRQLLAVKSRLSEAETKFFVAETIVGLNKIHSSNLIYRDLKPENLLLDLDGHIQITDFGLAKRVSNIFDKLYNRCGTYEVIAPEILKDVGYNCLADYYNIGTLTFELVTGRVPDFSGPDRSFKEREVLENLKLSEELQDFICKLLETDPENRLGAKKGLNEICSHPWLSDVNMKEVAKKILKPYTKIDPYTIKFKTNTVNYEIDEAYDYLDESFFEYAKSNFYSERTIKKFSFYGSTESIDEGLTKASTIDTIRRFPSKEDVTKNSPLRASRPARNRAQTTVTESRGEKPKATMSMLEKASENARWDTDEVIDNSDLIDRRLQKYTMKSP